MGDGLATWWNPHCGVALGLRSRDEQESCTSTQLRIRGGAIIVATVAVSVYLWRLKQKGLITPDEWKERNVLLFTFSGAAALGVLIAKSRSNAQWTATQANLAAAERSPERAKLLHAQQVADSAVRSADAAERQSRLEEARQVGRVAQQISRHFV